MFDLTRLYPHEPYFDDELRLINSPEAWKFAYGELCYALFTTTKILLQSQSYENFLTTMFFAGRRADPYVESGHLPSQVQNLTRLWRIPLHHEDAPIRKINITLKDVHGKYTYWFNTIL